MSTEVAPTAAVEEYPRRVNLAAEKAAREKQEKKAAKKAKKEEKKSKKKKGWFHHGATGVAGELEDPVLFDDDGDDGDDVASDEHDDTITMAVKNFGYDQDEIDANFGSNRRPTAPPSLERSKRKKKNKTTKSDSSDSSSSSDDEDEETEAEMIGGALVTEAVALAVAAASEEVVDELIRATPHGTDPMTAWAKDTDRANFTHSLPQFQQYDMHTQGVDIQPRFYKADVMDATGGGNPLDLIRKKNKLHNGGTSFFDLFDGYKFERADKTTALDGTGPARFHVLPPHQVQPMWPFMENEKDGGALVGVGKKLRFEFGLSTSSLTKLGLYHFHLDTADPSDPNALYLTIPSAVIESMLSAVLPPSSGASDLKWKDRVAHIVPLMTQLLARHNTTGVEWNVQLQVPEANAPLVEVERAEGKQHKTLWRTLSESLGISYGGGNMYATLTTNDRPLDPDLSAMQVLCLPKADGVTQGDFNSPEAARWREIDLVAIEEEIERAEKDADGMLRIDAGHHDDYERQVRPQSLLEYLAKTHTAELFAAARQDDTNKMREPTRELVELEDGKERNWLVLDPSVVRKVAQHYSNLYNPHRAAVNLHVMRLRLTPKNGADGWRDLANCGRMDLLQGHQSVVALSAVIEMRFLPWSGRHRLTERDYRAVLLPIDERLAVTAEKEKKYMHHFGMNLQLLLARREQAETTGK